MTFSFPTKTRRNAQRKNGGSNAQCGRFVPKDAAEPANADSADAAASTSLSLSELFDEDLLLLSDDGPEKHAKREWRQCLRNTDVSRRDEPIAPPTPTTPPLQRRRSPNSFMRRTFFSPPTRRIRRGRRRELGGTDPRRRSSSRRRRRPHFYDAELLGFHPVKNRLPLRIASASSLRSNRGCPAEVGSNSRSSIHTSFRRRPGETREERVAATNAYRRTLRQGNTALTTPGSETV